MKKLIREYYKLCPGGICEDYLTESEKRDVRENGALYLTGIIQHADKRNGNGRVYPRPILEREMQNYKRIVQEKRALGELDHPDEAVVNLKNASHMFEDVWWEGDAVYGKARVLRHTPSGKILEGLIKDGVQIGVSSRGVGSVREESEATIVEEDFQLICFDVVQEPSTANAFLMKEAKNYEKAFSKDDKIYRLLVDILR